METSEKKQAIAPTIVDSAIKRIRELVALKELVLPPNYIAENAIRAAWLELLDQTTKDGKPVLSVATKESVLSALIKMATLGLSVVKHQGAFLLYGTKLTFQVQYQGNKVLTKRLGSVKDITHATIYKGDEVDYITDRNGRKQIVTPKHKFSNINSENIIGAYAIVTYKDETTQAEIMSMRQITQAWLQGPMKGQSPSHKNFPDRMAEKTVANRLMTSIINASDDSGMLIEEEEEEAIQVTPKKQLPDVENIAFEEIAEPEPVTEPEPAPEKEQINNTKENFKQEPKTMKLEFDTPQNSTKKDPF